MVDLRTQFSDFTWSFQNFSSRSRNSVTTRPQPCVSSQQQETMTYTEACATIVPYRVTQHVSSLLICTLLLSLPWDTATAYPLQHNAQAAREAANAPLNVVILGVGRSGTTHLMNLIASLDANAFVLPEPYYSWEYAMKNMPTMLPARLPTVRELLDCSAAANTDMIDLIMWSFSCLNSPTINKDAQLMDDCLSRRLSSGSVLAELCHRATIRVVKTLRLATVATFLDDINLVPQGVKLLHIVRHPSRILRSQALLGWLVGPDESKPIWPSVEHHADRICKEMLLNDKITQNSPAQSRLTVLHEDLYLDFEGTMQRIMDLLGLPYEGALKLALDTASQGSGAALPHRFSGDILTPEESHAAVRATPSCQTVMRIFGWAAS